MSGVHGHLRKSTDVFLLLIDHTYTHVSLSALMHTCTCTKSITWNQMQHLQIDTFTLSCTVHFFKTFLRHTADG